jgi:hypothetical protein
MGAPFFFALVIFALIAFLFAFFFWARFAFFLAIRATIRFASFVFTTRFAFLLGATFAGAWFWTRDVWRSALFWKPPLARTSACGAFLRGTPPSGPS